MVNNADSADRATGLMASLQRLLGSFAEILHTRVDILSIEVEEAGWMAFQLILYILAAFLFLGLGMLVFTLFVVKASPEINQLYVLGGFSAFYFFVGIFAVLRVRYKLKNRPHLFSTTLAELNKDCKHIGNRS